MTAHDSSIFFAVDGDHSGGRYVFSDWIDEENRWRWHRHAQGYGAIADVFDGGAQIQVHWGPNDADLFFVVPPYAEGGGRTMGAKPTISITEFYMTPFDALVWNSPEESTVSELSPGNVIGLFIRMQDVDRNSRGYERYFFHSLSPVESCPRCADAADADHFVDAVLLGPGGEIPDDSAIESITWARIKAQFVE